MDAETASIAATTGGPTSSVLDELASYTACDVGGPSTQALSGN